jgi:hypothetical protein
MVPEPKAAVLSADADYYGFLIIGVEACVSMHAKT